MNAEIANAYADHIATWQRRADAALAASGFDHLLIASGSLRYAFLDDNAYPFRVNPHFKRWVPVTDNPDCLIIHTPGEKPKLAFHSPVDYWHKTHPVPDAYWTKHFDIHPVATLAKAVALLPKDRARCALIGEANPLFDEWRITARNPDVLLHHLHYHSAWKTKYEVACMREASRLGARGHIAAERAFREGASEYAIHLAYLAATEHNEWQLPYGNIVALNENGAILHYQYQERAAPTVRRSFLIDAGCAVNGYASDITRTYSAHEDEFQQLIERMDEAQRALCAMVKPGMDYVDLQMHTHRLVAEVLVDAGIASGSAQALVESGATRAFYPHGVGHYLGAQVHDAGGKINDEKGAPLPQPKDQPALRLLRRVEVDHVFTVEPGLYFIDSLLAPLKATPAGKAIDWQKVEALRPYGGIRIEDNVRVTADGHENLTRPAFAGAAA